MKKNLPLYILLIFLIIVNGFFLYNYLGNRNLEIQKDSKKHDNFLIIQLDFDENQEEQFSALDRKHHQRMRVLTEGLRELKDELFKGLSDASFEGANIDSIASLIGENEKLKDLEIYRHFKSVQEICNDEQKKRFSKIINDALRKGAREQRGPRGDRLNVKRPPQQDELRDDRPPPPEF